MIHVQMHTTLHWEIRGSICIDTSALGVFLTTMVLFILFSLSIVLSDYHSSSLIILRVCFSFFSFFFRISPCQSHCDGVGKSSGLDACWILEGRGSPETHLRRWRSHDSVYLF